MTSQLEKKQKAFLAHAYKRECEKQEQEISYAAPESCICEKCGNSHFKKKKGR